MAIYRITSLNYITAGTNRAFINMDTMLDYELCRPIPILRNEEPYISANAVSDYCQFSNVEENWPSLSDALSGVGTLDMIRADWTGLSSQVTASILQDMVREMTSTPLSVLCSDIVTEHREGDWYKTEYLAREYNSGSADQNAVALSSSQQILLNEQQRYYNEYEDGRYLYIRLYPPGSDWQTVEKIENFNVTRRRANRTFVVDIDLADRAGASGFDGVDSALNDMAVQRPTGVIRPMYDMIDVHVKSAWQCEGKSNLKSFDAENVDRRREDIYLPQLTRDPIGLCQVKNNAYMLTEATAEEPAMLDSSLRKQRLNKDVGRSYTVQIKSNGVKTYLYRKVNGVIDIQGVPQSNLAGIEYNNMTEFPQSEIHAGYSQGNEYGHIVRGKNALDSKYNMKMYIGGTNESNVIVYNCRDYAGIGQFSGNQLYVKFFDGAVYDGYTSGSTRPVTRRDKSDFPSVPYQKIECVYFNSFSSANMHKTRFFSIKVMNTELAQFKGFSEKELDPDGPQRAQMLIYEQIMKDVGGAIRDIVKSLQPAHTQLYKVMFES